SGSRFCNRNGGVSANIRPTEDEPRAGFTVSKAVGNAVTRNKTTRRLRAIIAELFESGLGRQVVAGSVDPAIRALPASSSASFAELEEATTHAVRGALRKYMRRAEQL